MADKLGPVHNYNRVISTVHCHHFKIIYFYRKINRFHAYII
jgi:hypothetical protein